jgi:hypothetical protein
MFPHLWLSSGSQHLKQFSCEPMLKIVSNVIYRHSKFIFNMVRQCNPPLPVKDEWFPYSEIVLYLLQFILTITIDSMIYSMLIQNLEQGC